MYDIHGILGVGIIIWVICFSFYEIKLIVCMNINENYKENCINLKSYLVHGIGIPTPFYGVTIRLILHE